MQLLECIWYNRRLLFELLYTGRPILLKYVVWETYIWLPSEKLPCQPEKLYLLHGGIFSMYLAT